MSRGELEAFPSPRGASAPLPKSWAGCGPWGGTPREIHCRDPTSCIPLMDAELPSPTRGPAPPQCVLLVAGRSKVGAQPAALKGNKS